MSWRDCLECKASQTKPKRGANVHIIYNPAVQMCGTPTIAGHSLSAEMMATRVLNFGIKREMEDYGLTREELLVACWWAGCFGSRKLRRALGAWAERAGTHLWYQCINIPDPPQNEQPAMPGMVG